MKQKSKKKKSNNKNNNSNKKRKVIHHNLLHNDNKNDHAKYSGGNGQKEIKEAIGQDTTTDPLGVNPASAAATNNNLNLTTDPFEDESRQTTQSNLEQIKDNIISTRFDFSIDIANNLYLKYDLLYKYNKILDDFNANTDTQSYIELLTYNASPDISNNCFSGYKLYLNATENYNYLKENSKNIINDIYLTWLIKSIRDLSNIIDFDKFIDDKTDSKYLKINLNLEFTEAVTNAGAPTSAMSGGRLFSGENKTIIDNFPPTKYQKALASNPSDSNTYDNELTNVQSLSEFITNSRPLTQELSFNNLTLQNYNLYNNLKNSITNKIPEIKLVTISDIKNFDNPNTLLDNIKKSITSQLAVTDDDLQFLQINIQDQDNLIMNYIVESSESIDNIDYYDFIKINNQKISEIWFKVEQDTVSQLETTIKGMELQPPPAPLQQQQGQPTQSAEQNSGIEMNTLTGGQLTNKVDYNNYINSLKSLVTYIRGLRLQNIKIEQLDSLNVSNLENTIQGITTQLKNLSTPCDDFINTIFTIDQNTLKYNSDYLGNISNFTNLPDLQKLDPCKMSSSDSNSIINSYNELKSNFEKIINLNNSTSTADTSPVTMQIDILSADGTSATSSSTDMPTSSSATGTSATGGGGADNITLLFDRVKISLKKFNDSILAYVNKDKSFMSGKSKFRISSMEILSRLELAENKVRGISMSNLSKQDYEKLNKLDENITNNNGQLDLLTKKIDTIVDTLVSRLELSEGDKEKIRKKIEEQIKNQDNQNKQSLQNQLQQKIEEQAKIIQAIQQMGIISTRGFLSPEQPIDNIITSITNSPLDSAPASNLTPASASTPDPAPDSISNSDSAPSPSGVKPTTEIDPMILIQSIASRDISAIAVPDDPSLNEFITNQTNVSFAALNPFSDQSYNNQIYDPKEIFIKAPLNNLFQNNLFNSDDASGQYFILQNISGQINLNTIKNTLLAMRQIKETELLGGTFTDGSHSTEKYLKFILCLYGYTYNKLEIGQKAGGLPSFSSPFLKSVVEKTTAASKAAASKATAAAAAAAARTRAAAAAARTRAATPPETSKAAEAPPAALATPPETSKTTEAPPAPASAPVPIQPTTNAQQTNINNKQDIPGLILIRDNINNIILTNNSDGTFNLISSDQKEQNNFSNIIVDLTSINLLDNDIPNIVQKIKDEITSKINNTISDSIKFVLIIKKNDNSKNNPYDMSNKIIFRKEMYGDIPNGSFYDVVSGGILRKSDYQTNSLTGGKKLSKKHKKKYSQKKNIFSHKLKPKRNKKKKNKTKKYKSNKKITYKGGNTIRPQITITDAMLTQYYNILNKKNSDLKGNQYLLNIPEINDLFKKQ